MCLPVGTQKAHEAPFAFGCGQELHSETSICSFAIEWTIGYRVDKPALTLYAQSSICHWRHKQRYDVH